MGTLRALMMNRKFQALMACGIVVAAAGGFFLWKAGIDAAVLKTAWETSLAWLTRHGYLLFAALVILPGLPVPSSALLFTAGVVWRDRPVIACLLCLLATALNLSWTYWLAAGPARKVIEATLRKTPYRIPEIPSGDYLKWLLVLKLTPGIPLFVQNYFCGLARVPFRLYLPVAMLCNGIIGMGIVLGGAGLGNGRIGPLLTGISLVALGVVLARWVRERIARRKGTSVVPEAR